MGIKESMEVLNALEAVVDFVGRSLADGKIDLRDLVGVIPMLGVLKDAFVGGQLVPAELKDGTVDEWQQLATKAMTVVQKAAAIAGRLADAA